MEKKKAITSLLFSSVMTRDRYESFVLACDDLVGSGKHSHVVPQLDVKEVDAAFVKCTFNFSGALISDVSYDAALEDFFRVHEKFLFDMLSICGDCIFQLSALINIDEDLEVFGLTCPRIPSSVASFRTFEFEYWIWHLPKGADWQEVSAPSK